MMEMAELPKEMITKRQPGLIIFRPCMPMKRRCKMVKTVVWAALLIWLAAALVLGANGSFVGEPGAPPLPIFFGVLVPIIVFLVAYVSIRSFHDFVMSLDLQLAAGIQAWRFAGLGFIALYAYGILPGVFAWSAGLGDIFIGITAVWVMQTLRRKPEFAASGLFRIWNLLGILDLVSAVSTGAYSAFRGIGITETVTTFPMGQMPLVLIPVFLVPLFLMLHFVSLLQSRHLAVAGKSCRWVGTTVRCGPAETAGRA